MDTLSVALVQMNSGGDKEANLGQAEEGIRRAAAGGADLVLLPEYFTFLGPQERLRDEAEPIPGPTTERLSALARGLGVGILAGSLPEICEEQGRVRNTSVFVSDTGEILARYSKIHLFDIAVPGEVSYQESALVAPGQEVTVFSWRGIPLGMAICYDLRFPELFRRLMQKGARVVLLCAAFTVATGRFHWQPLVRARAIENQVYLCAVNQWGEHPNGVPTYGHSTVVDPWGRVLCEMGDGNGVGRARISLVELEKTRRQAPILEHVRPWLLRALSA